MANRNKILIFYKNTLSNRRFFRKFSKIHAFLVVFFENWSIVAKIGLEAPLPPSIVRRRPLGLTGGLYMYAIISIIKYHHNP